MLSVVEKINEPRYPSFKGIMAAKKKPVETLSLADVGIDPGQVGLATAATEVASFAKRPPRQAGTIVPDEGDGGSKGGRVSRRAEVHLTTSFTGRRPDMAEILVLVEHTGEDVKKVTGGAADAGAQVR